MKGTDRSAEEQFLRDTMDIISRNLIHYGQEVGRMQAEIDEMLEHYHDADDELWTLLNNTITLNDHMKLALARNERARKKPYFGRIIFTDKLLGKEESLYIGKGGISVDHVTQRVIDWRAPIATVYYENGLGKCSYISPEGHKVEIDLGLKRTYEIEEGVLKDYFDTEVVSNDDLLTKYLSRNKEAVLGEIVATIQKEQNEIIRRSPFHNCIVQGVAGSGKTTVAMHRISYILYNYQDRFRPDDFYIVGSNRMLLNYITGVLPDLDVTGVKQMTMEQLMIRLLYEDWDEKKYSVNQQLSDADICKGTEEWYKDLYAFIRELEVESINADNVCFNPRAFVEGLENGKNGVYDRTAEDRAAGIRPRLVQLVASEDVHRYLDQNPRISIQSKILNLNERLMNKLKEEFLNNGYRYTEPEKKAITKSLRNYYGPLTWKKSIFDLYTEFLLKQKAKGFNIIVPINSFDVYDLAALALLYKLVKETEEISEAHHIVIDEAQDFGILIYHVLNHCIHECTYTIMGDTSQNIHFGYGLGDWNALRRLLLKDPSDSFSTLRKSYRNTIEISKFATNILRHGSFPIYPVEPIIRHGKEVSIQIKENADLATLAKEAAERCRNWQNQGYATIAVVCRDERQSMEFAEYLSKEIDILECDPEKINFANGIMVLPVSLTKGLEFDTVLLVNPTEDNYPKDDGHARLLYVAATRALHELTLLSNKPLAGLITDPVETINTESGIEEQPTANRKTTPVPAVVKPIAGSVKKKVVISTGLNPLIKKTAVTSGRLQPGPGSSILPAANTVAKAAKPSAESRYAFGAMPETSILRPTGHARINQAIKWVSKERDGIYLQNPYGIIRISPINSAIVRVTFCKGSKLLPTVCPLIAVDRIEGKYQFKEGMRTIEINLSEVGITIDKASGALEFKDGKGNILLAEKTPESRQNDSGRSWWYLAPGKNEQLLAYEETSDMLSLKATAKYISSGETAEKLPFIISSKGYGIVPASDKPVLFCNINAYGTYISEQESQADYYFIVGNQQSLLNAYKYLSGTLN